MKLSSINTETRNNSINNNYKNSPSFKGGVVDGLINFWQFIDNGGRAYQFTAEDMFGTNFPRSAKGLTSGMEYTGKINILAFAQEAIREFLTGPTMCTVPWVIITLAKKSGETADTHRENIKNISALFNQTVNSLPKNSSQVSAEQFQNVFYNVATRDMLNQTIGESKEIDKPSVDLIASGMKELNLTKDKKKRKAVLSDLQTNFETIIKTNKSDLTGVDYLSCKYSLPNSKEVGSTKFKNYVQYINAYFNDYVKKFSSDFKEEFSPATLLEHNKQFRKNWLGKRAMIVIAMIGLTGFLMGQVPKLYTMASGKVNPNASTIYDEAKKRSDNGQAKDNTQGKEVK